MGSNWSRPPGDLSRERVLRNCERVEFEGLERPSVGRMVLLSKLGQGGMGVVYHAVNPRLRIEVAVKLLPLALHAAHSGLVARFLREARLAARLRSPHLVSVFEVDEDPGSGCHFIIMEYVHGTTAGGWLSGLRPWKYPGAAESAALEICAAATKGVEVAHLEGVIHRDIKPANILVPVSRAGDADLAGCKLADLGLARSDAAERSLTGTQVTMGTPGYMAPEQATDAKRAKKPADVFAMGATLYALLTGRPPFGASSAAMALIKTVRCEYEPIRNVRPDVSAATQTLLETCLRRSPSERFPDATALLEALAFCARAGGQAPSSGTDYTTAVASLVTRSEQGKPAITDPPTPTLQEADRLPTLDDYGAPLDGPDSSKPATPRKSPSSTRKSPSTAEVASEAYRMVVGAHEQKAGGNLPRELDDRGAHEKEDPADSPEPVPPAPPRTPPSAPPDPEIVRRYRRRARGAFAMSLFAWIVPLVIAGLSAIAFDEMGYVDDVQAAAAILLLPSATAVLLAMFSLSGARGSARIRKEFSLRGAATETLARVFSIGAIGCAVLACVFAGFVIADAL